MSMLFNPEIDLDTVNPETVTVSGLISVLRVAFQPEDYKKVEEILVAREKKSNEEIQNWKRKYDVLERAHSLAQLNYIVADEQLVKLKQELRVKTEEVTRLREDKKLDDTKVAVFEERDKRVRAENDELFKEKETLNKEIRELKLVSEAAKVNAEKELANAERRNKENELRVTRLEKEVEALMGQPTLQPKVEKEDIADANGAPGGTRSDNSSVDTNMVGPSEAGAGFVIRPCGEGDSSHKNKRQKINTEYITISDDNIPRQAQTPNVPSVAVPDLSLKEKATKTSTAEQPDGGNRTPDVPGVAAPDLSMKAKETKTSASEQPDGGNQTPNVPRVAVPDVSLKEEETKTSASEHFDGGNQCSGSNRKRESLLDNVERENDSNNFDLLFATSSSSDSDDSDCDSDSIQRLLS